jgi:anti-sigma factor RsiW
MKCELSIELLSGYLDGELDDKQKAVVEKHLKECQSCRQELESLKHLNNYVKEQDIPQPSRDFVFTLNRRIMEKIRKKSRPLFIRLAPVYAPVFAAALVLIVVVHSISGQKRIGLESRVLYAETEPEKQVAVNMPEPRIVQPPRAEDKMAVGGKGLLAAPKTAAAERAARKPEVDEERMVSELEESIIEIPRDMVIRAIVDSTGKIVKVATGNTIVPEKDTMLENRLQGQHLSPPRIAGKRAQVYIDFTAEKEKTD